MFVMQYNFLSPTWIKFKNSMNFKGLRSPGIQIWGYSNERILSFLGYHESIDL